MGITEILPEWTQWMGESGLRKEGISGFGACRSSFRDSCRRYFFLEKYPAELRSKSPYSEEAFL